MSINQEFYQMILMQFNPLFSKVLKQLLAPTFLWVLCVPSFGDGLPIESPKPIIKVLALDGGGIKGIIPIKILSYIESRLGESSISHSFDIMSGTSSGGIIVLLLNIPKEGENKTPKYRAQDLHGIFKDFGAKIFDRPWYQKILSCNGWFGPKYNDEELNRDLKELMGKYTNLDTVKDVLVASYDLVDERNYFFSKSKAQVDKERQFYLKDIARATSAAPTYFNPATIYDVGKKSKHVMVDGGVSVNNPTLAALVYAFAKHGGNVDYLVVSIGTGSTVQSSKSKLEYSEMNVGRAGRLEWVPNIINLLMDSVNDVTDYEARQVLGSKNYYRLQVTIDPEHSELDNASPDNIKALEDYADRFIKDNQKLLDEIVERLKKDNAPGR